MAGTPEGGMKELCAQSFLGKVSVGLGAEDCSGLSACGLWELGSRGLSVLWFQAAGDFCFEGTLD